ncbi:MAG TPA: spermine/spermidine synthase, partial [Bacillota bacterium]|nr:spermine/spermidine synthase [Bacillota bacterium]
VGFSLAKALQFTSVQEVKVIEIEKKIIDWNRTYLSRFSGHALENPRTHIIHEDLLKWIVKEEETYDAICLDIDNGPDWTVTGSNRHLYQKGSLTRLAEILSPGGVVTFWSAAHSVDFQRLLKTIFPKVIRQTTSRKKGEDDCVYIAFPPQN